MNKGPMRQLKFMAVMNLQEMHVSALKCEQYCFYHDEEESREDERT